MFELTLNRFKPKSLLTAAISISALLNMAPVFAGSTSPVVLTFSTLGDSRQDTSGPDESLINANQVGVGNCYYPNTTGYLANPGLTGQDCLYMQNSTAWSRIIRTVQAQKSNLLFFNGDMIMGYGKAGVPVVRNKGSNETVIASPTVSDITNSDLLQTYIEYGFWRGMVAPMIETGTYVVPVPGNHETQCKRCNKASVVENEAAWVANMGDLVIDTTRLNTVLSPIGLSLNTTTNPWNVNNTPSATYVSPGLTDANGNVLVAAGTVNPDKISSAQQKLSYSFDVGSNHFAVINTDPVGNDSHAPYNWLDADLSKAVAAGAKNLFVFGHKPAYYYYYAGSNVAGTGLTTSSASSLFLTDATAANNFWKVIQKHNATYFCGHEHIYNVSQPTGNDAPNTVNTTPYAGQTNNSYQIIVGAGGSPFDDLLSTTTHPETVGTAPVAEETGSVTPVQSDRMYSWANVSVHADNSVTINTYGFDPTVQCNPSLNATCGSNFNGSMNGALKTLSTFTLPYSAQ
ncbi:metallophosphoesterase [Methylomonas sp. AM2-LC]|uniref:metallophosphoesterase n=1 Tax=Methylomonas sp. AM2-LC TaxID=3153301 RepID=UPI003263A6A8